MKTKIVLDQISTAIGLGIFFKNKKIASEMAKAAR